MVNAKVPNAVEIFSDIISEQRLRFVEMAIVQADGLVEKELARDAARRARGETREEEITRTYEEDKVEVYKKWQADRAEIDRNIEYGSDEWCAQRKQAMSEWREGLKTAKNKRDADVREEEEQQHHDRSVGVPEQPARKRQRLLRELKESNDKTERANQQLDELDGVAF